MNNADRISALEAALEPFAKVARREELHGSTIGHADIPDEQKGFLHIGDHLQMEGPTMGDYRKAAAILAEPQP